MNPRISLEVELRRQDRRLLEAGLDMDMRRPHVPGLAIVKRLDGAQRVASLVVGVELAAQEKARVVIAARVVRLPDVEQRTLQRSAMRIENAARDGERRAGPVS